MVLFAPTGAVLGSWGGRGDEERGLQDSHNGSIQFNGIDYIYLSSLAGSDSHKGFDEAGGKLLRTLSAVRCSIRYSQKLGRWSVRTTKSVPCSVDNLTCATECSRHGTLAMVYMHCLRRERVRSNPRCEVEMTEGVVMQYA